MIPHRQAFRRFRLASKAPCRHTLLIMCDTVVKVTPARVWFAKNSDRDANEPQVLDWRPAGRHAKGDRLRCTWMDIPQAAHTHAVLLSRPVWMWGAEMAANEHGVIIGNEAVFTRQPYAKTGLTGMDLVRLGAERAASAREAVEVITALLESHGQGGGCGYENRAFTYHNSFLIADAAGAFVLETAGRHWAVETVSGARSISNGLTIPGFAATHADPIKTRVGGCRLRQPRTQALASEASRTGDFFALLRDHGEGRGVPRYAWHHGGLNAPSVHAGGLLAAAQTTASWVAELTPTGTRHWVTATAAPTTSLFKPVRVDQPLDLGVAPGDRADDSLWWRHERFHRMVMRDPERAYALYRAECEAVEARWLDEPPEPADAFAEADALVEKWTAAVAALNPRDTRPWYVRRYWRIRNQQAGMDAGVATSRSG